ncbi:MAG TPA: ATP-binding protein [Stellaceae bacterium]|nr:ATP-binding protein [Stellaceae bacterium]
MDGSTVSGLAETRVGRIIAVAASQAITLVESGGDASPGSDPPLEMGALVKVRARASTIYGLVTGLRVPLPNLDPSDKVLKIAEIDLIGEVVCDPAGEPAAFRRGVSAYPALDEPVYLATPGDLALVYARPSAATVRVGTIHQNGAVPAYLLIDELFGKHFSVVGTTGSGKSCVVATILSAVIERNPNAHIVVFDPHNEYAAAFGPRASVLSPGGSLYLPYWLFNFEEIVEIVVGSERHPEQAKILGDAILAAKQVYFAKAGLDGHGTIDTPAPYRLSDVIRHVETAMGSLNRPENAAAYQAVKNRVAALQADARYGFVFGSRLAVRDELAEILSHLFRIPVAGRPITIVDLSGIPSEVVNVVVSVLCRLSFDFALWSDPAVPITIVCEEAHRYAPRDSDMGFEPAKRALCRIAKEGRKYGVSLCVISQRPSDLEPALLSECNTMFALRMINQDDQDIVRSAVPEAAHGLMNFLPALRNGEAIAVGEGVSMAMRICFAPLPENRRPKSATASFSGAWAQDVAGAAVERTVERWRRGIRDPHL